VVMAVAHGSCTDGMLAISLGHCRKHMARLLFCTPGRSSHNLSSLSNNLVLKSAFVNAGNHLHIYFSKPSPLDLVPRIVAEAPRIEQGRI
jgi:hypothetical protein